MDKPARCLVLGGTGYVGAAVVERLSQLGAQVSFTWHTNAQKAEQLSAAFGAKAVRWSAADPTAPLLASGPLSALVQCIGTAGDARLYAHDVGFDKFLAISLADWQSMQDVTATSTFLACQALATSMAQPSNIVIVGSMDGVKTVPAPVHYAAGKAAVSGIVRALAKALGPRGVCVNMIAAGILEGGVGALLSAPLKAQYLKHCSLKRLGTAQEVAALVAWLALKNSYISGQAIVLDGGV
jgi:3-oxoacyl-[acyl-carrier protein] reductase